MPPIPAAAFDELRALYRQLDTEMQPFRRHCDARGLCCHLVAAGHMLYVTGLEAAEMARSGATPADHQAAQGACPYLHEKLCGIREHRALGCRTYFCDTTYRDERADLHERMLARIREIETSHGIEATYTPVIHVKFSELVSA